MNIQFLILLSTTYLTEALKCLVCGDPRLAQADCLYNAQGEHLDGVTEEEECNDGWCEVEFRRGSEYPSIMRCVPGDPTKSKVTWSPYAQINEEKNIWCQWPGFGLADVRCVCKQEDYCNNLEKPGKSNRNFAPSIQLSVSSRITMLGLPLLIIALAKRINL